LFLCVSQRGYKCVVGRGAKEERNNAGSLDQARMGVFFFDTSGICKWCYLVVEDELLSEFERRRLGLICRTNFLSAFASKLMFLQSWKPSMHLEKVKTWSAG
jgi:hypothetical protein